MVYHGASTDDWRRGTFADLDTTILTAVRAFEASGVGPNVVLVATGISGASLAFPLACKLGTDVAILRKETEDCHGNPGGIVGIPLKGRVCVFVDDFVSGGQTRARVQRAVEKDGGKILWQYTSREEAFVPFPGS